LEPDVNYVQIKNNLLTTEGKRRKWKYAMDSEQPVISFTGQIGVGVNSASMVLPVRNPNAYFIAALRKALTDKGIVIVDDSEAPRGIEIFAIRISAAPLLSILDEINQRSQNLHAEMLFRNLGKMVSKEGSVQGGIEAETKFLRSIGISPDDFQVFDGCGLSPSNKVKPSTVTRMLASMAKSKFSPYYMQSFASPHIGSGSKRMGNLEMPWRTCFKTGYISETHALVGYVLGIDGDTLAAAIYLNNTGKIPDYQSKNLLDTLWSRLVDTANEGYASLLEMKGLWLKGMSVHGYSERIRYFSQALLGRPYSWGQREKATQIPLTENL
jgi:D-alanyl-D-alanine carboxypeptidase/D-alanyl-D-alanine-endopeptidase (penicillin-binding protein 4)